MEKDKFKRKDYISPMSTPLGTVPPVSGPSYEERISIPKVLALLTILGGIAFGFYRLFIFLERAVFFNMIKMFGCILVIILLPAFISVCKRLITKLIGEIILFNLLLFGAFYLFEISFNFFWFLFGALVITFILISGYINQVRIKHTLQTFSRRNRKDKFISEASLSLKAHMQFESKRFYLSLPLGLFVGAVLFSALKYNTFDFLRYTILSALILSSLAITGMLILDAIRMGHPNVQERIKEYGDVDNQIDLACVVAEVRKVYLNGSTLNAIILTSFIFLMLNLFQYETRYVHYILLGVFIILVFVQAPYLIGQEIFRLHILKKIHGIERQRKNEILDKYCPLLPAPRYFVSTLVTGSVGYIVFHFLFTVFLNNFK